jgi:hypothetical protein
VFAAVPVVRWVDRVTAGDNMNNRDGWHPVTCLLSDELRARSTRVSSSLTDWDGEYGDPVTYTEWSDDDGTPLLRDYVWFHDDGDNCEHLTPDGAT